MEVYILAAIIGLIPAYIAHNKGRNFFGWWAFGFLLWIVAFPASLIISKDMDTLAKRDGDISKCPHCAEWIKPEARVCKHCGRERKPLWQEA